MSAPAIVSLMKSHLPIYTQLLRILYTIGHYLAFPAIMLRLLWRSRHNVGYRSRWNERFGYVDRVDNNADGIWVHAVSVGESLAAVPLIKAILNQYPNHNIIVTATTPTGSTQILKHLRKKVLHYYTPYDVPSALYRFIRRNRIKTCIIMETEIWPNLQHCCRKKNIPLLLANARLSQRSLNGLRFPLIRPLIAYMLDCYTSVCAQSVLDGERLLALGLDPKRLMISGNVKFDIEIDTNIHDKGIQLRKEWRSVNRPTFIAASTHEGEEELLLKAFKSIREEIPNLLLIIAPRNQDRFNKVFELCVDAGYKTIRRSLHEQPSDAVDILLADTFGELMLLYAASDIAFVGGSLVPWGGHNLIEPAALGLPALTGPHLYNFAAISKLLKNAGAAVVVNDYKQLAAQVIALFSAKELREQMGQRALEVIERNSGSVAKHLAQIEKILPSHTAAKRTRRTSEDVIS